MSEKPRTALIIDDDHHTRVSIRNCLEDEGFFVFSATNGADGLRLLEQIQPPKFIILDMNMPVMDGQEFLKKIRENKEQSRIPVVQVSAGNYPRQPGVCCHIPKPFGLKQLLGAVQNCPILSA